MQPGHASIPQQCPLWIAHNHGSSPQHRRRRHDSLITQHRRSPSNGAGRRCTPPACERRHRSRAHSGARSEILRSRRQEVTPPGESWKRQRRCSASIECSHDARLPDSACEQSCSARLQGYSWQSMRPCMCSVVIYTGKHTRDDAGPRLRCGRCPLPVLRRKEPQGPRLQAPTPCNACRSAPVNTRVAPV